MTKDNLFPMLPFLDLPEAVSDYITPHEKNEQRKSRMLNLDMAKEVILTQGNDMPIVSPFSGHLPDRFISYSDARTCGNHTFGVHFYLDDYKFNNLWNEPKKNVELLRRYECVIGPDYSQFLNMPKPARYWNNFRNKLMMAWMQAKGLRVIPNVTWSDPESFEYCFEGMPKHSIIAINSLGALSNADSTYFWLEGYKEALRRLEPAKILRYGRLVDGECESISVYVNNPYTNGLDYGR